MSWSLYTDGRRDTDPIVGNPYQFEVVEKVFRVARESSEAVAEDFRVLQRGQGVHLVVGRSADSLATAISGVEASLDDLPKVASQVERIFREHAHRLHELNEEADRALARAKAAWNRRQGHQRTLDDIDARISWLDRQIGDEWHSFVTDALSEPDPQEDAWREERDRRRGDRHYVQSQWNADEADVEAEISCWERLRNEEIERERLTVRLLDEVDFHSLADPGWWSDLWESLGDIDWANVLWRLRDFLDDLLLVLAIVSIFVSGGALAGLILVLAASKLLIDVTLFTSGVEDPQNPGRTVSGFDVLMSAVSVVFAGAHYNKLKGVKLGLSDFSKTIVGRFGPKAMEKPDLVRSFLGYERNLVSPGNLSGSVDYLEDAGYFVRVTPLGDDAGRFALDTLDQSTFLEKGFDLLSNGQRLHGELTEPNHRYVSYSGHIEGAIDTFNRPLRSILTRTSRPVVIPALLEF